MNLNIGTIKLPISAATKTFAILAKRGAGKTYTAGVMAEEFYKNNIPFVVFDPIDVWWGLRFAENGKDKGLPVVVFGLEHADIKLDRDMGRRIAQAVVRENVSVVISTFGLPKVAQRHLIAEFSEELLNINNTPRHIFVEEAHEFVPQRVQGAMGKVFSAVEALIVMGRNRGIGVTLINQRAATVNKDVLTQLDTLIALRNIGPQDRKALKEWVEAHSAEGDFDNFMSSLPSLPTGEAWIWSPEFMGVFEKIKIRKRETFHPDREKLGNKFVMPKLEQIDIQSFVEKFNIEKSQEKNKKAETLIEEIMKPVVPHAEIISMRNEYESQLIQKDTRIRQLEAVISNGIKALSGNSPSNALSVAISVNDGGAVALWQSKLGNGLSGKVFKFLSENPNRQFNREQICLAIGVPSKAGHTNNEFGKIMKTGAVVKNGNLYQLNPNL